MNERIERMSVKLQNIEQTMRTLWQAMRTLRALRECTQTQAALAQVLEVYGVDLALRPSQDQLFRAVFPDFAEKHGIQDYEEEVADEKVPF